MGAILFLAVSLGAFLKTQTAAPPDYVLARLTEHRIVILGENHWIRDDTQLVAALVPQLKERGAVLASETFPASQQKELDRLLAAETWDAALANRILRADNWPYTDYRDILHAAWQAKAQIVAIGPPTDWREQKIDYDRFMADLVSEQIAAGRKVLVYCGMHHAFTRYLQVERRIDGRVTEFMDRMGNVLWRRYGEQVFLIALHKPEPCGDVACAPFNAAIDCAAAPLARPVAFDVAASPIAELKFPATSYYAAGHPLLRFIDYADGYIWSRPIDELRFSPLVPFEEYATAEEKESAKERADYEKWIADFANPYARERWRKLGKWRESCGE